jgi:hypothetical protein
MPYLVKEMRDGSVVVYNPRLRRVMGIHKTRAAAMKQIRAVYASERRRGKSS